MSCGSLTGSVRVKIIFKLNYVNVYPQPQDSLVQSEIAVSSPVTAVLKIDEMEGETTLSPWVTGTLFSSVCQKQRIIIKTVSYILKQ